MWPTPKMVSNGSAFSTQAMPIKLEDIECLSKEHCKIKDPQHVQRIINEFAQGGAQRLQLVSDYDCTITKQRLPDGTSALSSFGIFNACPLLPPNFVKENVKLYQYYHPIEIDPHVPMEEKIRHMNDWWHKKGELLAGFKFDPKEIDHIAHKYKDSLRDHTHELFETLNRLNIPVLVFSAGLGDSVVSVLRQSNVLHPNVKVISNFLKFKDDNILNGFLEPLIHSMNKNETVLKGTEYYDLVQERDHIILMADSLGDAGMAEGVPSSSHTLKIGFLFDHITVNLPRYMDAFDVVLVDDQTMDVPRALLEIIEKFSVQN